MRQISFKRSRWLEDYRKILQVYVPSNCARCGALGGGWVSKGSMEPHHPLGRSERAFVACILPLCNLCHEWVHHNGDKAREDGWILRKPRTKQERDYEESKKSEQE